MSPRRHRDLLVALGVALLGFAVGGCPEQTVKSAAGGREADEGDDVASVDTTPDVTRDTAYDAASDARSDARVDAAADATADVPPPRALPDETVAALESLVADAPRSVHAPGVSVHVRRADGRWSGAAGIARGDVPVEPSDRFRVGSITKTFVGALVVHLAHDGTLSLDEPASRWVPDLALPSDITLRHLLGHTAGLYNFTDDAAFIPKGAEPATPEEVIAFAEEHGRTFAPGEGYNYSNTGYFVLGRVIEEATGQPLDAVLRARLLTPLGLDDSFLEPAESPEFVDGHLLETEATQMVHASWAWAAGGMVSNTDDLCDWAFAAFAADAIPADGRAEYIGPGALNDGTPTVYGLGVRHSVRGGAHVIGHTGSTMGFRAELFFEPDTATCVAILSNDFFAELRDFSNAVWEQALSLP